VYFAFIQAFRYRVSGPAPLGVRRCIRLALYRTALGVVIVAGGALAVAYGGDGFLPWSWAYLYAGRAGAWFVVGRYGAAVRGRRLVGWTIGGTVLNAGFDAAMVLGLMSGPGGPVLIAVIAVAFIAALNLAGRRRSLRARFDDPAACPRCLYDLRGSTAGRCPECGRDTARRAAA
jgi:hypothetical protein